MACFGYFAAYFGYFEACFACFAFQASDPPATPEPVCATAGISSSRTGPHLDIILAIWSKVG